MEPQLPVPGDDSIISLIFTWSCVQFIAIHVGVLVKNVVKDDHGISPILEWTFGIWELRFGLEA